MFKAPLANEDIHGKIKVLANRNRFRIVELTQDRSMSITELKKQVNLAYTKCADYVRALESAGLVKKTKKGRERTVKAVFSLKNLRNCLK